jgi:hypothetical protein
MADEYNSVSFEKRFQKFFGPAFRAVAERQNFDFMAILQFQVERDDGTVVALMWPEPLKNFYLEITDVLEKETEWWLITPHETWVARRVEPARAKSFAKALASEGIHG